MGNRFYQTAIADRFWAKVQKTDGCWLWIGCIDRKGYGQINKGARRGHIKTHRLSWLLHRKVIPAGICVLHRCDNPPCVRPDHLFLGTLSDNTQDMLRKGRSLSQTRPELHMRGDSHTSAKLSYDKVAAIKELRSSGHTQTGLARMFNVSQAAIWFALHNRTWQPAPIPKQLVTEPGRGEVKASETLF